MGLWVSYIIILSDAPKEMKKISILVPAYNEQESLPLLYDALRQLMDGEGEFKEVLKDKYEWDVLLVNDGSRDDTLGVMRQLHERDKRICYLDLSRNYGKETAMLAGFDYVTGDCMIIMDADLQHPPKVIPQMIEKWEEGYEDVYAERLSRGKESWLRKRLSLMFYRLLQKTTRINVLQNVGDFRLLDRRAIEALKKLREHERYTKGMYSWIGFRKTSVPFETADRVAGESSWNFWGLLRLAIEGIVSFTTAPLKLASALGFIVSFSAFCYMVFVLLKAILYGDEVAGYPTIITLILFLGGCILLCLGIIGEYLARIFIETKNRPTYIAREYNNELI